MKYSKINGPVIPWLLRDNLEWLGGRSDRSIDRMTLTLLPNSSKLSQELKLDPMFQNRMKTRKWIDKKLSRYSLPRGWHYEAESDADVKKRAPIGDYDIPAPVMALLSDGWGKFMIEDASGTHCVLSSFLREVYRIDEPKDLSKILEKLKGPRPWNGKEICVTDVEVKL